VIIIATDKGKEADQYTIYIYIYIDVKQCLSCLKAGFGFLCILQHVGRIS
jgi:hypothetical protein